MLNEPGYDEGTGLYYHPGDLPQIAIPEFPTFEEARQALDTLRQPYRMFPFTTKADQSVVSVAH